MNKSESIAKLAIALSKFQGEVENPKNTATNPFFKSSYSPLDTVLNTVRPILAKHGLSVVQIPSTEGSNIIVTTILMHESGEYIETEPLELKMDKITAQGAGSAITYARRYALSAVLGVASEDDDDGNAAEPKERPNRSNNKPKQSYNKPKQNKEEMEKEAKQRQLVELAKIKKQVDAMPEIIKEKYKKESSGELTIKELDGLIDYLKEL